MTCILKGDAEPIDTAMHVFLHAIRDADPANFRQGLQARCHVHPIAMDAGGLDDIADVDPHAELEALFGRHLAIAVGHRALDFYRATQRVDDTGKKHQQPVARRPGDPPTMFADLGLDELGVMGIQLREGALVVGRDQAAVAGDVGHQDGHQPALEVLATHRFPAHEPGGILSCSADDGHKGKPGFCTAIPER